MRRILHLFFVLLVSIIFVPLSVFAKPSGLKQSICWVNDDNPTGGIESGGHVYFGRNTAATNQFDACWQVLDADHANNGEPGLFLLTENLIGDLDHYNGGVLFDEDGLMDESDTKLSNWKSSDGHKWCQDFTKSAFSKGEQDAMLAVTRSDNAFTHHNSTSDVDYARVYNILENDKVFFLSAEEAANVDYGFNSQGDRVGSFDGRGSWWWLRSTTARDANGNILAAAVDKNGEILSRNVREESAARPALNVDYSRVLFTSAAVAGKPSTYTGSDALSDIPAFSGRDWKLTVLDEVYNSFRVTKSSRKDNIVSVSYSGACPGDREYLSAIVCDEDGELLYYGRIGKITSPEGTVKIDIRSKVIKGDHLYVFQEQANGDKETDYAGDLIEISLKETVKIPEAKKGLVYSGQYQSGVESSDLYTLSNPRAKEAGTYTTVCSLRDPDSYQWEDGTTSPKSITWTIDAISVGKLSIAYSPDMDYTGKPVTQKLLISGLDSFLKEGVDYTVSYSNNVGPGTALMTIRGKGNYKGLKQLTFTIGGTTSGIISKMKSDEVPDIIQFSVLALKTTRQKKGSVSIGWKKISGASKYVVFGNRCGLKNKLNILKMVSGTKTTVKKMGKKKLKKGTYYKFLVMALDKKDRVVAVSKTIHVATKGGKVGNDKRVITAAKSGKVILKAGSSFKLKAKAVPEKSKKIKVKRHRKIKYESTNESIARISKAGVIRAVKPGTSTIYAFAQDGIYAMVKVVVK